MKALGRTLSLIVSFLGIAIALAACSKIFGDDTPPAAQQQSGPVVVPVINQGSDNSGWFVLITFLVIGSVVGIVLAIRAWLKERDAARDAVALTNRVLDALPDDVHREISYTIGYQPGYRVTRTSVEPPPRRAIGGPR